MGCCFERERDRIRKTEEEIDRLNKEMIELKKVKKNAEPKPPPPKPPVSDPILDSPPTVAEDPKPRPPTPPPENPSIPMKIRVEIRFNGNRIKDCLKNANSDETIGVLRERI